MSLCPSMTALEKQQGCSSKRHVCLNTHGCPTPTHAFIGTDSYVTVLLSKKTCPCFNLLCLTREEGEGQREKQRERERGREGGSVRHKDFGLSNMTKAHRKRHEKENVRGQSPRTFVTPPTHTHTHTHTYFMGQEEGPIKKL